VTGAGVRPGPRSRVLGATYLPHAYRTPTARLPHAYRTPTARLPHAYRTHGYRTPTEGGPQGPGSVWPLHMASPEIHS
jgi:hypothetical protein